MSSSQEKDSSMMSRLKVFFSRFANLWSVKMPTRFLVPLHKKPYCIVSTSILTLAGCMRRNFAAFFSMRLSIHPKINFVGEIDCISPLEAAPDGYES
jgi:hypothetical protein